MFIADTHTVKYEGLDGGGGGGGGGVGSGIHYSFEI